MESPVAAIIICNKHYSSKIGYMKLIVDIGNTLSKLAVFDGEKMVSFKTFRKISPDNILSINNEFTEITSAILSSVAMYDPKINEVLNNYDLFIKLDHSTPVPYTNKYSTPHTLGKDRIAIASAAAQMYKGENTLVIDTGTSITYDMVTAENEYLGGGISPGLKMRFEALHNFTHSLPLIDLPSHEVKIDIIGDSTETSILSGVINGLTAEIESIINQYSNMFSPLKIVISGGDYKYFEKLVKSNIFAAPNIVVTGLKCILDFNEKN